MPLLMSLACCAQALLLDYAPQRAFVAGVQFIVPLLDKQIYLSTASIPPMPILVTQCLCYILSLYFPIWATWVDSEQGNGAMNAVVKTLAPCVVLVAQRSRNAKAWLASLVSYSGFLLAAQSTNSFSWLAIALLCAGMLCGVALGLLQQKYGCSWYAMSVAGTSFWIFTTTEWPLFSSIGYCLVYGVVSHVVQRQVRAYSESVAHNALKLSSALNERRALSILIYTVVASEIRVQWIVGAMVALAGAVLAQQQQH